MRFLAFNIWDKRDLNGKWVNDDKYRRERRENGEITAAKQRWWTVEEVFMGEATGRRKFTGTTGTSRTAPRLETVRQVDRDSLFKTGKRRDSNN